MIKNYIKIAWRNLLKNKAYSFINIFGLATGMMICILVLLLAREELSYEKWNENAKDIYRAYGIFQSSDFTDEAYTTPGPLAMTLTAELPEVAAATRVEYWPSSSGTLFASGENKFYVKEYAKIDSNFHKVFPIPMIYGDPNTAFNKPYNAIISKELAYKIFANKNPIGKTLQLDNKKETIITGVFDDNQKSQVAYDVYVVRLNSNRRRYDWNGMFNYLTYVKLHQDVDPDFFEQKMKRMYKKYSIAQGSNRTANDITEVMLDTTESFASIGLQPLTDIHLYSTFEDDPHAKGNIEHLYIYSIIAIIILLIACINFMNLATARSAKRAKEVGVRKVLGSNRRKLFWQFITEAILHSFLALILALVLAELLLPIFNNILEKNLNIYNGNVLSMLGLLSLLALFAGVLAGIYPAFFLSSFKPVKVLKGNFSKSKESAFFRKGLVVFQFSICTIFILFLLTVVKQINYFNNKNLGFQPDQIINVPIQTRKLIDNFNPLKRELLQYPNIKGVSKSLNLPGEQMGGSTFYINGQSDLLDFTYSDEDYLKVLNIELVEGTFFTKQDLLDTFPKYVVNEAFVRRFGLESPIVGQRFDDLSSGGGGSILGVMKDFHLANFNQPIKPFIIRESGYSDQVAIKIETENINETLEFISETWANFEPNHPMQYSFFDKDFGKLFKSQTQFSKALLFITILILFTALLGLFGLASYTAEQRTKEIGIRKILGASNKILIQMLIIEFIKLIALAAFIALPIAFFISTRWLAGFAYQTNLTIIPYITAIVITLLIALITVITQAYKAAQTDPIVALKYE